MTATTSPIGPMRVRSRRRISAIVATPTAMVANWSWPGWMSVLSARTTLLDPSAA